MMNNFTKEELLLLFEWGTSLADAFPNCFDPEDIRLYNKLQSMIDIYFNHECEHQLNIE